MNEYERRTKSPLPIRKSSQHRQATCWLGLVRGKTEGPGHGPTAALREALAGPVRTHRVAAAVARLGVPESSRLPDPWAG